MTLKKPENKNDSFSRKGEIVKRLRLEANLTQRELVRRSRVAESVITRVECGHVRPEAGTLVKLAMALEGLGSGDAWSLMSGIPTPRRISMVIKRRGE